MRELIVTASTENLNKVLDFITAQLEANGCPQKTLMQIIIAAEEIFVNIAYYAYGAESGNATIRVNTGDNAVIEFEDGGVPFNPLGRAEPDIDKPISEREIGGLGIFMVKKTMDDVSYEYTNNKNILTITKSIKNGNTHRGFN